MLTPTFASAYKAVAFKEPGRVVRSLIPQYFDRLEPLRNWLLDAPDVAPNVRAIAASPHVWSSTLTETRQYHSTRTSPSARWKIAQNITARVLRTPDFASLPNAPRFDGGSVNMNALLKARVVTAYVGKMQLDYLNGDKPVTRPYIHIKNMVPVFGRDRGTMRQWLQWAEDFGLLFCDTKPEEGSPGKWIARPLKTDEARLSRTENDIAAALTGATGEVLDEGVWEHFAATLILNVGHPAWHQKPRTMQGPNDWWTLLQLHTGAPRMSEKQEALYVRITSLSDLDGLLTDDGRKAREAREAKRAVEREHRTAETRRSRERNDTAWEKLQQRLGWPGVTKGNLVAWVTETVEELASWPEPLASDIRKVLGPAVSGTFATAPDLPDALKVLAEAPESLALANLHGHLGWDSVTADTLFEWTQSLILALIEAPDILASSIRTTLLALIPPRFPDAPTVEASLNLLKGAA
jgi:hypothetical protein